jgi:transposase InsO family protein
VAQACRFVGLSRQAYYQGIARAEVRQKQEVFILDRVREERMDQPRVGTRKLHAMLKPDLMAAEIGLGRDALFNLLRRTRLLVPTRRAYHKTTDSHHRFRRHPNLLNGALKTIPSRPEEVWVADITYLPTREKFAYLSLVTDAYSRKIVGYHVHPTLQTEEVAVAFKKALKHRKSDLPLIHHSDRGLQYCSTLYQEIHTKHGVTCSMTDGYDCYQNALAERVNGILKGEFLLHKPENIDQARQMVNESVRIYNEKRMHLSLKYKTPDAVHQAFFNS